MESTPSHGLPFLIITGELRDNRANYGNSFDPDYTVTEGQYRALYMKLNRIIRRPDFSFNSSYEIDGHESVYFVSSEDSEKTTVYAIIVKEGVMDDTDRQHIQTLAGRGSVYTAKRFYEELVEMSKSGGEVKEVAELSGTSQDSLSSLVISEDNLDYANQVLQHIASAEINVLGNLHLDLINLLGSIPEGLDADIILDSSFRIARKLDQQSVQDKAYEIYLKVAEVALQRDRLALMITCRLRCASIARQSGKDPAVILNLLEVIDDGSLEVASQDEREQFYTMQGYCFQRLDQAQLAEDLHYMAVMIAESETSPSIFVAESHAYLGKQAGARYQPEVATSHYLTASTIASANSLPDKTQEYSHLASLQELGWSNYLASAAVVMHMNSDEANTEFYSWQSLKRLVNSLTHADRSKRKEEFLRTALQTLDMVQQVFPKHSEYGLSTISQLENQIGLISEGSMPVDQEKELLRFITSKISAMLPLPPPMILLIANDGRMFLGGEIGSETWDQSILSNDDLFSGALSAIMAILSEVISGDEPLRMLDAGQTQIMIEKSSVCIGALLVDRDLNVLRKALRETVQLVELEYPGLEDWDGYSIDFSGLKPKIEQIFDAAIENISQ